MGGTGGGVVIRLLRGLGFDDFLERYVGKFGIMVGTASPVSTGLQRGIRSLLAVDNVDKVSQYIPRFVVKFTQSTIDL